MYHEPYEDYSPYIYGRINRILNNRIEHGLGFQGGAIRRKRKDSKCKIYQQYNPKYWLTLKGRCIPYSRHISNYRKNSEINPWLQFLADFREHNKKKLKGLPQSEIVKLAKKPYKKLQMGKSKSKSKMRKPKYILPQNIRMNKSKIDKQLKELERLTKLRYKKPKKKKKSSHRKKKKITKKEVISQIYNEIENQLAEMGEEEEEEAEIDQIIYDAISQIEMQTNFIISEKDAKKILDNYLSAFTD
jgi:hypothetical protein